jgi:hypothetical protein
MVSLGHRWDGDTRGAGIGDGGWITDDVDQFKAALNEPDWIAEEPAQHLLPHLRRACGVPRSPWTLLGAELMEMVYVLSLRWARDEATMRQLRADVYGLVGAIAESVSYLHQRVELETVHYDVVTGMLATDTAFHPHGHLLELRISGPDVPALCAGTRVAPRGIT